jgi:8-oxo-dGTP diphosphatase
MNSQSPGVGVDYIGVSAGAVIVNGEGKYFLAKRGKGARDDVGRWEFPGGTLQFFETREAAAKRNVLRKYGFEIIVEKQLDVYDVIDQANKDHWISTTYICKPAKGSKPKIMEPEKCSDIGWFTLDELQKLDLSRITRLNVQDLVIRSI